MLEQIGKYEIRQELGRGAMGVVYEGYDTVIGRRVAIKKLLTDKFLPRQLPEVLERFRREAQSAGRLAHPHIVTIHDYGEQEGAPYIVMEYITGRELGSELARGARYSLDDILRLMTQLLEALAHAHENGVVHRDVKPANMFVLEDGSLKVVDFGIARVEESELTETGAMIGTPAYMSPEQFLGLKAEARSDIYSAGVIFYQLLTGDKPFTGSVTTIMHKVLALEPLAPSVLNPTLAAAWDAIVARAVAKKPEARYNTARQFAETIKLAYHAERGSRADLTLSVELRGRRPDPGEKVGADEARKEEEARLAAEARARSDAEETVLAEEQERARRDAEENARAEAQRKEEEARREAEEQARKAEEERARAEALRKETAQREAEEQARKLAENEARAQAKKQEEARREAERLARAQAEARAKKEAEAKARAEAAALAKKQDEEKAKAEAAALAKKQAEEKAKAAALAAAAARKPGRVFRDCPDCPQMVVIPAGEFMMGTPATEAGRYPDEGPVHRVTIANSYALGRNEVTLAEFRRFVEDAGYKTDAERDVSKPGCFGFNYSDTSTKEPDWQPGRSWRDPGFKQTDRDPVVCVSWNDSRAYVQWLSRKSGKRYRLPTEAEWEYAARAGTTTARYWGDNPGQACQYANVADQSTTPGWSFGEKHECNDGHYFTAPVGSYAPNKFGLYDVLGNAWEWTEDCYNTSYAGAPSDGSAWLAGNCSLRLLRGGSWVSYPRLLRSGLRFRYAAGYRKLLGFRLARTLE